MESRKEEMEEGRNEEKKIKKEMKESEEQSHIQLCLRISQKGHVIYIHLNTS